MKTKAEYSKEWREKNPEKYKAQYKRYYEKNKERVKIQQKAYVDKNREKINARMRRYYAENKEKYAEIHRRYMAKHPRNSGYFYPNCKLRDCDFIEDQLEEFRKMKNE